MVNHIINCVSDWLRVETVIYVPISPLPHISGECSTIQMNGAKLYVYIYIYKGTEREDLDFASFLVQFSSF